MCLLRGTDWIFIYNSTFCPHTVFMCFVWIWEQTAINSLYSINWLVFITEECVYCAVRTGSLNSGDFRSCQCHNTRQRTVLLLPQCNTSAVIYWRSAGLVWKCLVCAMPGCWLCLCQQNWQLVMSETVRVSNSLCTYTSRQTAPRTSLLPTVVGSGMIMAAQMRR